MFFKENLISDELRCPYCKKNLEDPRILECGESVCNICLISSLNKEKTGLTCEVCNEFHEMPKNGFIKIKALSNLTKIKPSEVSRTPLAAEFKSQLNKIREKSNILEQDFKMGKQKIKEYCDFVKCDIETLIESWHRFIDKCHSEFDEAINKYEKECVNNYEHLSCDSCGFESLVNESNSFFEKWHEYLKSFVIDDSVLFEGTQRAKEIIMQLDKKSKDFHRKAFNGQLIKFEGTKNMQSNLIGRIHYQSLSLNCSNFECVYFMEKLTGFQTGNKIAIESLPNGFVAIVFQNSSNNLTLMILDHMGTVLKQSDSILVDVLNGSHFLGDLKLIQLENALFVYHQTINKSNMYWLNILVSYDKNLNKIKEIQLRQPNASNSEIYALCFTTCGNSIFGLFILSQVIHISAYDSNLQIIRTVGQSNPNSPYYIPPTTAKIEVTDEYFIMLSTPNEIHIMNRNDGTIFKHFQVKSQDFSLYMNELILSYDCKTRELYSYTFDGKLESQEVVSGQIKSETCLLIGVSNEQLIFYDAQQVWLYFSLN